MSKLKVMDASQWELKKNQAAAIKPIYKLEHLPKMEHIAKNERAFLQLYAVKHLLGKKKGLPIWKLWIKHPISYSINYLKGLKKNKSTRQVDDFFLYQLDSLKQWSYYAQQSSTLLVVGFSYCEKPFECPDGRFSDQCRCDLEHLVCQQCPISKIRSALPIESRITTIIIPTVHDIGTYLFQLRDQHPKAEIVFAITACQLTLEMFGPWAHALNLKGIGIRLSGRICNTKKAFALSEEGIKPGLTVVAPPTHDKLFELMLALNEHPSS